MRFGEMCNLTHYILSDVVD